MSSLLLISIDNVKTSDFCLRVKIGLFCSTPGVALGRSIPRKTAMKMLFTGEPISAEGQ